MSTHRLAAFKQCATYNESERDRRGLTGVSYSAKMEDDEIVGLSEFLKAELKKDKLTPDVVLTYQTCSVASDILCRWPRPSELARVIALDTLDFTPSNKKNALPISVGYFLGKVPLALVDGKKWGDFVGKKGATLNALTKNHELLYSWLKDNTLYLYAFPNKKAILNAVNDIEKNLTHLVKLDGEVVIKSLKLTKRSKDFVGQEPASTTGGGAKKKKTVKKTAKKTAKKTVVASVKAAVKAAVKASVKKTKKKTAK